MIVSVEHLADRLSAYLTEHNFDADTVLHLPEYVWQLAASVCDVPVPNSALKCLVLERMQRVAA